MKTLWQKLTEVNRGKILLYKQEYPYSGSKLITTLETEISCMKLSVEDAYRLLQETTKKEITINNLLELFYEN
jgi:hypothetical protein